MNLCDSVTFGEVFSQEILLRTQRHRKFAINIDRVPDVTVPDNFEVQGMTSGEEGADAISLTTKHRNPKEALKAWFDHIVKTLTSKSDTIVLVENPYNDPFVKAKDQKEMLAKLNQNCMVFLNNGLVA